MREKQLDACSFTQVQLPLGTHSMMTVYWSEITGTIRPISYIWTNYQSLFYTQLPNEKTQVDLDRIGSYILLPCQFNTPNELNKSDLVFQIEPLEISQSEFHYFILNNNNLVIGSKIKNQLVQQMFLPTMKKLQGIKYDDQQKMAFIISNTEVKYISLFDEIKLVWNTYLKEKNYQKAFELCKQSNDLNTSIIALQYADQLYSQQKYMQAAEYYLETKLDPEQIILKFIQIDTIEGYQILIKIINFYLNRFENNSTTQSQILNCWLLDTLITQQQLLLHNLMQLDSMETINQHNDPVIKQQFENLKQQSEQCTYQINLLLKSQKFDHKFKIVIAQLLEDYNLIDQQHSFAKDNCLVDYLMQFGSMRDDYQHVYEIISKIEEPQRLNLICKYKCEMINNEFEMATRLFIENIKIIDLNKMLFSFCCLKIKSLYNLVDIFSKFFQITFDLKNPHLHNYYIYLLCEEMQNRNNSKQSQIEKLFNRYFDNCEKLNSDKTPFIPEIALEICRLTTCDYPKMRIYKMIHQYKEAVILALQQKQYAQASQIAKHVQEKGNQNSAKELWLLITKQYLSDIELMQQSLQDTKNQQEQKQIYDKIENYMKSILTIKSEAQFMSISDLIQQMDSEKQLNVEMLSNITQFIIEYCEELENQKKNIDKIASKFTKKMIKQFFSRNNSIQLKEEHICAICQKQLLVPDKDIIYYPCLHTYHKDCAINFMQDFCAIRHDNEKQEQISKDQINQQLELENYFNKYQDTLNLQQQLMTIDQTKNQKKISTFNIIHNLFASPMKNKPEQQQSQEVISTEQAQIFRNKVSNALRSECPKCGKFIIFEMNQEFNQNEKESWTINIPKKN